MKKILFIISFMLPTWLFSASSYALEVRLGGIENGGKIPPEFAFCQKDGKGKTKNGGNINPEISWSGAVEGVKSYALIVVDPDVPTIFDDANKEGKTLPSTMKRRNFYHWALVDIPPEITTITKGQDSNAHLEGGKKTGKTPYGVNGRNDYAEFMQGTFGGYDGPCPPWNDEIIHHYHFRIYALDVKTLELGENFTGKEAESAMSGHILASGEAVGIYSNRQ